MVASTSSVRAKPRQAVAEGANDSREAIITATIGIMRDQGYAAVSSRRIAERAGLKSKLVHYYFKTMDDLFLAVYKRIEEQHFDRVAEALSSERPLHALWQLNMETTNTSMVLELTAAANHRKILGAEIARASERFRLLQAAAFERAARDAGKKPPLPPLVVAVLSLAVSRLLAMDRVLGVSSGHEETLREINALLASIEAGPGGTIIPPAS
jgi:AcrR family transcriptional regulator